MSTPSEPTQNETVSSNVEESTNSVTKAEATSNSEEATLHEPNEVAKKEPASQSVSNGALAESETKVVTNGLEPNMNGQEEKPSDGQQRPIPDLLPLTTSPTPVPQGNLSVTNSSQPKQGTTSQPLPLNTTTSPVVATKSAPPPIASSPKTRGRTSSSSAVSSSPSKEQNNSSSADKSTEPNEERLNEEKKETKKRKPVTKKRDSIASSDSTEKGDGDSADGDIGRKSKRARTRTQPFQSSDLDTNLFKQIIKASAQSTSTAATPQSKANEEKLVVFFKGEFLAVRNAEGGFYVCQAMQNINRGSHKIRIRWLSQAEKEEPKTKRKAKAVDTTEPAKDETGFDIYTPDFYDTTDFECILTNLELEKFGKDRYGLPEEERTRTENILRRALEVEQGKVDNLELTEEHPDGLDVSLFHDESQLKRKRRKKAKQTSDEDGSSSASSSEDESDSKEEVVATTSGRSRRASKPAEPEPKTSTSGVASTSSGSTKRTRAAAARQKYQMRYRVDEDEDSSDDDEDDDDLEEEEDTSSDSDAGKRRRGRPATRRPQKAPTPKTRGKATPATRSTRGKKLATPKRAPIPIIKKAPPKTPTRQATETASKRRKLAEPEEEKEEKEEEESTSEKVVTVDVEMAENETKEDSKADAEPVEAVEAAKDSEEEEAKDDKDVEQTKSEESTAVNATEVTEVAKDNEDTNEEQKSEESPKEEVKPSAEEPSVKSETDAEAETKEPPAPEVK